MITTSVDLKFEELFAQLNKTDFMAATVCTENLIRVDGAMESGITFTRIVRLGVQRALCARSAATDTIRSRAHQVRGKRTN
jgi:hypothetical protein